MPEEVLHVSQMKGFERPPVGPTPLTVWHLQAAADKKAAAQAKAESDESTPAAEQEQ